MTPARCSARAIPAPRLRRRAALALLVVLAALPSGTARAEESVAALRASLDEARAAYASDALRARELAGETFLRFESSGLDRGLAARDPSAYKALEADWLALVTAMRAGAPAGEIAAIHRRLDTALAGAEPVRTGTSRALFANSLLIILREGFEAILILSAVATSLRAAGHGAALRSFWSGAGAAVAASFLLAALAGRIGLDRAGEAVEGITCLLAVAVLFVTSYWLISRVEGRRWQQFIRDSVRRAASAERLGGLAVLAFVVVFREGFETVLFYQALLVEAAGTAGGSTAIAAGLGAGVVLLALLHAGIRFFGLRIPMRGFFAVTGGLLYVLAIKFAGVGIRELQLAGWLTPRPVAWLPEVAWLRDWLGIFPDGQTLALQGVLVLAVVVGLLLSRSRGEDGVDGAAARHAA